ncbi:MAG TPA: TROVE domain-containing protein [Ktedonobacterales bacterium]|nr:TROVE domain-containing protein [Ktedonobacterales bacterium]
MAKTKTTKATKIQKLFGATAYSEATTRNYEGAPAFVRGNEEQLVRVLMTGNFEHTYYASDAELAGEAIGLFRHFAATDPHFLAQAIVYARAEGLMRIAPITALVVLSAADSADAKELFRRIFSRVILTPGDLQDVIALCRRSALRGMGKAVTRAANRWLAGISQYHVVKYGSESQQISLRDIYRMTRPKLSGEANAIARYVVKGEVAQELTQIAGYEEFKRTARSLAGGQGAGGSSLSDEARAAAEARVLALIGEYRLPWEVVAGQVIPSRAVWERLLYDMPYMALLRNLNNMVKYGVTDSAEALDYITRTLADPQRVASGKQLPFRYFSAIKALKAEGAVGTALREALSAALELSFANMPELGRRVLVANDISGSMSSRPSPRSDMTMGEIAGIFAAAVYKKAESGEIVSFDTVAHPRAVSKRQGVAEIAQAVSGNGGGTSLAAPLEYAFKFRKGQAHIFDTAVFITDSESWYDHLTRTRGVLDEIREYRKRVRPDLKCFFVQLLPYKHAVVPESEPGCYYIYGWSGAVLGYIASMVSSGASQVEAVKKVSML